MDFVQAKSILDKFAQVYRAAEFMGEALDTAASLERRGMELKNNVENLLKEQTAQQAALDAMQAAFVQSKTQMQTQQAERIAGFRADAARVQGGLAAERAAAAQALEEARAQMEDYTTRSTATITALDSEITEKSEAVRALQGQIEALKALAQQVLS